MQEELRQAVAVYKKTFNSCELLIMIIQETKKYPLVYQAYMLAEIIVMVMQRKIYMKDRYYSTLVFLSSSLSTMQH